MAAFRDLILGARIGSETRRDPMRKMMIAIAAAFSVCTATMTSATPAAFARGGGSFGGGTHGFGGGGFGGHGFAVGRSDGGILEAALAILAAAFGTGASADLDLASMDTRAGSTPITAMAPVWCPLLTATPGLATDIQHRNLLSALHPQWVRRLYQLLGRQQDRCLTRPATAFGNLCATPCSLCRE
jgi:hypothetical protein